MASNPTLQECPCGDGLYASCCGRFIDQDLLPAMAVELMRSRYSAYVLKNDIYLRATWHSSTRPGGAIVDPAEATKWLGLDLRHHEQHGDSATVEFVARCKINGRAHRIHEVSRFVRESTRDGERWFYVDGIFPEGK